MHQYLSLFLAPSLPPSQYVVGPLAQFMKKRGQGQHRTERWGAGVETQKNVRGEVGGWGRVPFNEPYAPSLSTIYDGA